MEHLEEAGIHSGDSSCTLPPVSLGRTEIDRVRDRDARRSPRASACAACSTCSSRSAPACSTSSRRTPGRSRTVPFVSKALGIPLAKAASRIMAGSTIAELKDEGLLPAADGSRVPLDAPVAVKEAVLPFKRFRTEGRPDRRLRARPRDALDRRGHGHRPRLPDRVREEPGGRVRRHAADGHGVHLGRRQRQARRDPARPPAAGARLHARRDRGHRRDPRAQRHRGRAS